MNDSPDNPKKTHQSTRIEGVTGVIMGQQRSEQSNRSQYSDRTGGSPVFIKVSHKT